MAEASGADQRQAAGMTIRHPVQPLPRHRLCADMQCRAMRRCCGTECAQAAAGAPTIPTIGDLPHAELPANDLALTGAA